MGARRREVTRRRKGSGALVDEHGTAGGQRPALRVSRAFVWRPPPADRRSVTYAGENGFRKNRMSEMTKT